MIVEINEMIDFIEDFFKSDRRGTVVGGIAGTEIERFVLEGAVAITDFSKVLVVNGCQDYLGLMKNPLPNVIFWGDLFVEQMVDPLIPINPWIPKIYNPKPEYVKIIDKELISHYEVMVVLNAHLIDSESIRYMVEAFPGKIIFVCDPCESVCYKIIESVGLSDIPVVIDTLSKVSPMIAMARAAVGFETRSIDRKVPGTLTEVSKMNIRSVGKIDDKQYITDDYLLCQFINDRQRDIPFRKNQKVLVRDIIDTVIGGGIRKASLVHNSMLVIKNPSSRPLMTCQLYNSKTEYHVDLTYNSGVMMPKGTISVDPANIISVYETKFHRYNHSVLVLSSPESIQKRDKYSVLKNSNNVTVVTNFKY